MTEKGDKTENAVRRTKSGRKNKYDDQKSGIR
jgi:hypothetical protein